MNISVMTIYLFLAIFACFACGKEKTMNTTQFINTIPADTSGGTVVTAAKYLALGDSYTIGQNVEEKDRFPAQTMQLLANQQVSVQSVKYIATTGWTSANLIDAINAQKPPSNFDIVTLLIGVNDQYQHVDTAMYRSHFTDLLNTSVTLAGSRPSRVFVISIPDYSATPFVAPPDKARVSQEIDAFNAINKEITLAHNIAYVDITPASRDAANNSSLVASDGLHPSGKEYAKWAALLAPVIKNAVK